MNCRKLMLGAAVALSWSLGCDGNRGSGPIVGPQLNWGPGSNTLYEPPPWDKAGIVGDWFLCNDEDCESVDNQGFRFTEDGQLVQLRASEFRYEQGDAYCEDEGRGRYVINGDVITVTVQPTGGDTDIVSQDTVPFEIDGDRLTLFPSDLGEEKVVAVRVERPNSTGVCRGFDDVPVRTPTPVPAPGGG